MITPAFWDPHRTTHYPEGASLDDYPKTSLGLLHYENRELNSKSPTSPATRERSMVLETDRLQVFSDPT